MHHLAGVGDDGVVLGGGGVDHVAAADVVGDTVEQIHVFRAALGAGGDDVVRAAEESAVGVKDAGGLLARHGMASDEIHLIGKDGRRVHDGGFDTAYVGDQGAGPEARPVGGEEVHDAAGMETQIDHICSADRLARVGAQVVGHAMGTGKFQCGGVPVHPHNLIVLKALQGHSHGSSDQP